MSDKKDIEIDIDELENVAGGGCRDKNYSEHLPSDHGEHIGMYATDRFINRVLYFVCDNETENYFLGRLTRSWEHDWSLGSSKRVYDINVFRCSNNKISVSYYNESGKKEKVIEPGMTIHRAAADALTIFDYTGTEYK